MWAYRQHVLGGGGSRRNSNRRCNSSSKAVQAPTSRGKKCSRPPGRGVNFAHRMHMQHSAHIHEHKVNGGDNDFAVGLSLGPWTMNGLGCMYMQA